MPCPALLLSRWFLEAWLEGRIDVAERVFSDDVLLHLPGCDLRGIESLKIGARELSAFENLTGSLEVVSDGAVSAATFRLRGRHVAPYLGAEPTGLFVELEGALTARLEGEKLVELWQTFTGGYRKADERACWARYWCLTPRETDVASLVMSGYGDKQIAASLKLATTSINKCVHGVLRKAGADSRAALAGLAGTIRLG